jgi:very-short-patch-repair endonuclease
MSDVVDLQPEISSGVGSPASSPRLECECSTVLNFAMEQNGVPLVREVLVVNEGSVALEGAALEITVEPGFSEPLRVALPDLAPGARIACRALELPLVPGKLREVTEAELGAIRVRLLLGDRILTEHRSDLRVLAYNEWPGSAAPAALLSAFVLPNHPVVTVLLQGVREALRKADRPDAIDGYQSGDPGRARELTEALHCALQSLGIGYVGLPASFEQTGQKIRLPDAVVGDRLGCCLDLAVLYAAVLEQMGLAPLLFLVEGHAFVGVWLKDERFPEGVVEDAARVRTLIELGQILPIEATAVASTQPTSFDVATQLGLEHLRDDASFRCALDVRVMRTEYRPVPIRTVRPAGPEGLDAAGADGSHALAQKVLARAAAVPQAAEDAVQAPPPTDVAQRFRRWKERLLDLSLRNRLLNCKLEGKGACQLAVPDVALLENGVFANRSFAVLPRPDLAGRDERDAALAERRVHDQANQRRLEDLGRFMVHTRHGAEEMWSRLKHLDREARTALEEGGASILYLAMGFLRWYETASSPDPLLAPVLLYPVELRFDPRVRRASMRRLPEDPVLNVTLLEKLRRDHAVGVEALSAIPMESGDGGVDVAALFARLREAIQRLPRWEVLEEAHLGLFSFTKFLMWKDLDDNADRFLENPVVRRIASRDIVPLAQQPLVEPDEVDERHPADLPTVLDADSTQLAAIASSLEGQSFVLQGPPGTGKSQTIANLVAANLARGRTVLFVSEKMAALEVVHRRLCDVGLADFCLELHSHKANKKDVVESLRRALVHERRAPADGWREHGDRLLEARRLADRYVEALHAPRPLGPSVYEMRGRLHALRDAPDVPVAPEVIAMLDRARLDAVRQQVDEFAGVAAGVEPAEAHPFRASRRKEWSAALEEQVRSGLASAESAARGWESARAKLAQAAGAIPETSAGGGDLACLALAAELECAARPALDPAWPRNAERARACIGARKLAEARRAELSQRWAASFLDLDASPLVQKFERWAASFFLLAWIMLWGARRRLKAHARGPMAKNAVVLGDLRTADLLRNGADALRAEAAWAGSLLGTGPAVAPDRWEAMLEPLDAAHAAVVRIQQSGSLLEGGLSAVTSPADPLRKRALAEAGRAASVAAAELHATEERLRAALALDGDGLPSWQTPQHPQALLAALTAWGQGLRRLRPWCLYQAAHEGVAAAGFAELPAAHATGRVPSRELNRAFEKAVLRVAHAAAVDADPELREFDAGRHTKRVSHFAELDREHVMASRQHVANALEAKLPPLAAADIASSEPAIVMREAQKKTRHLPIRKLLQQIPSVLPRLKPCLLMSPMSVAQYLPAEAPPFDLVVFDEASQISTHDAIGAIARGRHVVVVGDSRQMPPTSFFTRTDYEEEIPDENDVVELESVLEEAVAKLIPQQWLGWHYRSRHESLIDFSNRNIYEGRLDVFPAAQFESDDIGVHWQRVKDGVYQGGKGKDGRTNRKEAEAVVEYLVGRFKTFAPGERSYGVVTFNMPQQNLILDLLDEARVDPDVDRHFDGSERVFVKNLENVQGDERDEIAFSICSAPDVSGRFTVAVGALNTAGGERRLNVAITRARKKLIVFSSIEPELIDRSRTKSKGIWLLRDFLQFARDGRRAHRDGATSMAALGPLEREMAAAIRAEGLQVDTGVGCSGYRLDLAVRDPATPGRYGLAVESDGPAYRMARTARDRDRLRGQVLSSMGWRVERVWSTGWWYDDGAPTALANRVKELLQEPVAAERYASAPAAVTHLAPATPGVAAPALPPINPVRLGSQYLLTALPVRSADPDVFYLPTESSTVRNQVAAVVSTEGPIHLRLLGRRIADHWEISRLTARPMRRIAEQVEALVASGAAVQRGEFVWPAAVDPRAYRDFRTGAEAEPPRELPHIPPEEIANAAEALLRAAGSLDRDALAREVASVFGVQRMGANVKEALEGGVDLLVASGRATTREGRLALTK